MLLHHHADWIAHGAEEWLWPRLPVCDCRFQGLDVGEKDVFFLEHVADELHLQAAENDFKVAKLWMVFSVH